MKAWQVFWRGLLMGSADAVPGVSGGTIAFITGIYPRLIAALASAGPGLLFTLKREGVGAVWRRVDGSFLTALAVGIASGILLISSLVLSALENYPTYTWSLFLGLVLGAVPLLLKDIPRSRFLPWACLLMALGVAAGVGWLGVSLPSSTLGIFSGGVIALSAMILPGISGSFLLLVLGLYTPVFGGIHARDLSVLLPFAAGGVVGLMVMSRLLKRLFERDPGSVTAAMAGLMLGSAVQLWPFKQATDYSPWTLSVAFVCFCVGGGLVWLVSHFSQPSRS